MAEWSKATDCKSVIYIVGSNPTTVSNKIRTHENKTQRVFY